MKIIFTSYAEDTISDRAIPKEEIIDALLFPFEIKEGMDGRFIAHKIFGEKLLRVVFEISKNTYIVVTAYYTNQRRYIEK